MKNIIFCVLVSIFIAGCGASKPDVYKSADSPASFLVPPIEANFLYGVGMAKKQNPSLSKKTATTRARAEVSQAVSVKVSTLMKDFMQESGMGENAQATELTESISKQVSNNVLNGSVIKEAFSAKDGTIYILVELPLQAVNDETLKAVKKDEALFNEFKATKGFNDLDQSVNNM